jgi:hypothetical protein
MLKDQKYILVTGAPGSKWSSVVKNIYWSDDIDRTDYSKDREYYHEADTPGRAATDAHRSLLGSRHGV